MTFDISNVDPERIRLQLESAVQSHEFTITGLVIDLSVTQEALDELSDDQVDEHHGHTISQLNSEIEFYTKKYQIAKRKLDEFLANN
jgi:hypothetical protein